MDWYALTVRPKHERAAADHLGAAGFHTLLPLYRARRRWSDRMKEVELPLFPGYVLCRFPYELRVPVLRTAGVRSIVTFGKLATAIPEDEIANLQRMLNSGCPVQPWPYLEVGQRVRVVRGPLSGVEGILLRSKDTWRVVLSIELLQRSAAVEVERDVIVPC